MQILKNIYNRFLNSWLWFNIYYRHTKQHKNELKEIKEGVLRVKNKVLSSKVNVLLISLLYSVFMFEK